jgi:C-terminal processing protease CtpA/Prc
MESVWQYLKTYCIWQDTLWHDTLPADAFKFATPEELLNSVHDTLKGADRNYTSYDSTSPASLQNTVAAAGAGSAVSWDSLSDSTGYILINYEFVPETYAAFLGAFEKVKQFHNIVIDLRNNGGGNLNATDSIIQSMLPDSTPYIVEKYRKYDRLARQAQTVNWDTLWTNHGRQLFKNKRYAVLANRGSASASEILVAALKDGFAHAPDTTVLVGDTTYGKGMGQIVVSRGRLGRPDIKITFLRIKGLSARVGYYHRKGILPDVHVDCDSLENLIADLIRRMNSSQAKIDTLQRKCDSLNISAALKSLEPSAHLHKLRVFTKRFINAHSDNSEAEIMASPEDFPVR